MARQYNIALFLALSLFANAFCLPASGRFRQRRDLGDNQANSEDTSVTDDAAKDNPELNKNNLLVQDSFFIEDDDDDDDDEDDEDFKPSSSGGSNIFSLLNLASAFLPTLSGNNNVKKNNEFVKKIIRESITRYQAQRIQKRQDIGDNVIEIDYATELKPPFFQRQESEENDDNNSEASESHSEEDDGGAEESVEQTSNENDVSKSKQDSASNASNANDNSDASDNDSDYDEPEGDGQGGGILGLLAGLSGDGESDLGTLLATVGGIVANLSGDGIDLNAIIATALGLFVGLLSDEGTNPGEVIASYLLTSLDTISGGGAQNNGAFFGKLVSTLVKGTSAVGDGDSSSGSQENGGMKDSAGFFASLLMGLLGDMSKHSSASSWR